MDDMPPEPSALAEFTSKLSMISTCFVDQVEGPPTLGELLEVFGLTVPGDIGVPVKFKVKLMGRRYVEGGGSRVGELNDSAFVLAAETLATLMARGNETAQSTSQTKLASRLLTLALKASGITFADARAEEIVQISSSPTKRVSKSKLGDVVAIPAKNGGYRIAVVVARNRFGTALGFFRGEFAVPRLGASRSGVASVPIYTDDQLIAVGVWRIIGHDVDLLDLFPRDPEIYHAPDIWPNLDLGEFGAAETADGGIRPIGAEEADVMGVRDGSYRQVHMSEQLQRLLDDGLKGID